MIETPTGLLPGEPGYNMASDPDLTENPDRTHNHDRTNIPLRDGLPELPGLDVTNIDEIFAFLETEEQKAISVIEPKLFIILLDAYRQLDPKPFGGAAPMLRHALEQLLVRGKTEIGYADPDEPGSTTYSIRKLIDNPDALITLLYLKHF